MTDLVFAAYVEKPTMAETVEPNARMLTNTLEALAVRNVPLRRIVLAGGAKSYGFSLGAFNAPAKETDPRLIAPIHYHRQEDIVADWSSKNGASWTVLRPHLVMGPSLNSPMNLVTSLATYAAMSRDLGLPLRFPGRREGWNTLQETTDAELFGRATLWALGEDNALLFRPAPVVETYPVGDDCPYSVWYVTTGNVPAWGSDYATSLDSFWTVVGTRSTPEQSSAQTSPTPAASLARRCSTSSRAEA